jgi:hypothetical protein
MTKVKPITEELRNLARELFEIDPSSPSGLRWKKRQARCVKIGDVAGGTDSQGYRQVVLNGKKYKSHRVIWAMVNDADPGDLQIDHIDGNPLNNSLGNLRLATHAQNQCNQTKKASNNTSGIPGVSWHSGGQKWSAHIGTQGKRVHLGCFACKEEASMARREAELKYFGEFAPRVNDGL